MFYQKEMEKILRFGDVLRGYIFINTTIKKPILDIPKEKEDNYKIYVEIPKYSAVLTPCCSIGEGKKITLCPLEIVKSDFLKNPNWIKDLTKINREMEPEEALPPEKWKDLKEDEQKKRKEEGRGYVELDYFIYDENELFDEYPIKDKNIKYYMIDFKKAYSIKCDMIKRPEKTKPEDVIIKSKILQLTIEARGELRDKIAYYYGRVPEEDKVLED